MNHSELMGLWRRDTPAQRAAMMADLFNELETVVGRLLAAYEANSELNSEQPEYAAASYAMSIDEWLGTVAEGTREWEDLAKAPPPAPVAAIWTACRFGFEGDAGEFRGEVLHGETWNGWPIVRVTGETRRALAVAFLQGLDAAEMVETTAALLAQEPDEPGADRYTLHGYTPHIVEG